MTLTTLSNWNGNITVVSILQMGTEAVEMMVSRENGAEALQMDGVEERKGEDPTFMSNEKRTNLAIDLIQ